MADPVERLNIYEDMPPESLLEERRRATFADLIGKISCVPIVILVLRAIVAATWRIHIPIAEAALGLSFPAVILGLWAATRGSRWGVVGAVLTVGLFVLFLVGVMLKQH